LGMDDIIRRKKSGLSKIVFTEIWAPKFTSICWPANTHQIAATQ
jgi:hypothetical protein